MQAVVHFQQQTLANLLFCGGQLEVLQGGQHVFDGQGQEIRQCVPIDGHIPGLRLQSAPLTTRASGLAAVPAQHDPVLDLVALGLQCGEKIVNAPPGPRALPQLTFLLGAEVRIWRVNREVLIEGVLEQALLVPAGFLAPPRGDSVVVDAFGGVRNDQVLADADHVAKPFAGRAGTLGTVETEQVRRGDFKGHAVQFEPVAERLDLGAIGCHPVQFTMSMSFVKRSVHGVCEALFEFLEVGVFWAGKAVDDQVERRFR